MMFAFLFKKKQLPAPVSEFGQDLRLNYRQFWDVQNCSPAYLQKSDQFILIRDPDTLAFVESTGELMMDLAFRIFTWLARAVEIERPQGFEKFVLQSNSFAAMRAVVMTAGSRLTDHDQGECLQILVATTIALRIWPDHAAQALGETNVTLTALLKLGEEQSVPFLLRKTAADLKKPLVSTENFRASIASASQACLDAISNAGAHGKLQAIPKTPQSS